MKKKSVVDKKYIPNLYFPNYLFSALNKYSLPQIGIPCLLEVFVEKMVFHKDKKESCGDTERIKLKFQVLFLSTASQPYLIKF